MYQRDNDGSNDVVAQTHTERDLSRVRHNISIIFSSCFLVG